MSDVPQRIDYSNIRVALPHQLGWLRRPELEMANTGQVWELPNGQLYYHDPTQGPLVLRVLKVKPPRVNNQ